jgi:hypothetical protein
MLGLMHPQPSSFPLMIRAERSPERKLFEQSSIQQHRRSLTTTALILARRFSVPVALRL